MNIDDKFNNYSNKIRGIITDVTQSLPQMIEGIVK